MAGGLGTYLATAAVAEDVHLLAGLRSLLPTLTLTPSRFSRPRGHNMIVLASGSNNLFVCVCVKTRDSPTQESVTITLEPLMWCQWDQKHILWCWLIQAGSVGLVTYLTVGSS